MNPLDRIAEARITAALERGELSRLRLAGERLALDDAHGIPAELRAAFLLLKGAGFLPPEAQQRKEVRRLSDLLAACSDDELALELRGQLRSERLKLELMVEGRALGSAWRQYRPALRLRLGR